jgi:ATP adenylyltransferase
MFERGELWDKVEQTTDRALRSGALQPIPTDAEFIEEAGVRFLVRVIAQLEQKRRELRLGGPSGRRRNPFLPFDQALHVADVSESHVCLLNKYNVVNHHLLIVTRQFERQEAPLTLEDFRALWTCMAEYDSLGFYNAGRIAGASQPHKHLQLAPLPLAPGGPDIPIAPLIEPARRQGRLSRSGSLPFLHAVAEVDPRLASSPATAAGTTLELYHGMLNAVGLRCGSANLDDSLGPYNLLVTRRWMLLAPRSRESFERISVNALGLAGALLVRNEHEMNILKQHGPMAVLRRVTVPWPN